MRETERIKKLCFKLMEQNHDLMELIENGNTKAIEQAKATNKRISKLVAKFKELKGYNY